MKRNFTLIMAALMILSSCRQIIEGTKNNPAGDYRIELTSENQDGVVSSKVETALNKEDATELATVVQIKDNGIQLRIGGIQFSPYVPLNLSANIIFFGKSNPEQIVGTYEFPANSDKLTVNFGQRVGNDWVLTTLPVKGRVIVNYDANTKTWNGEIRQLEYNQALNSPYKRQELNIRFNHVPLR